MGSAGCWTPLQYTISFRCCNIWDTWNIRDLSLHFSCIFSLHVAGFVTSTPVTVVTSTSWSVITMAASTNTTGSGAPTLRPSRCSPSAGFSSEGSSPSSLPPSPTSSSSSSSTTSSSPPPLHSDTSKPSTGWTSGAFGKCLQHFLHAIDLKEKSERKNSSRLILWAAQWCDLSFAPHRCHDAVCAKEINKGYTYGNYPLWEFVWCM